MSQYLIVVVFGVVLPGVLYTTNRVNFWLVKRKAEAVTGRDIPVSWRSHQHTIWVGWHKYLALLIGGALWQWDALSAGIHEIMSIVLCVLTIIVLITGVSALRKGFVLGDFVSKEEVETWYSDDRDKTRILWFSEAEHCRERDIKHLDYIPMILDTLPLIQEKSELQQVIANISTTASGSELEQLEKAKERLVAVQDTLNANFDLMNIATGFKSRPEVVQARKEESLKKLEVILEQPMAVGKPVDPALKELYALIGNEDVPNDLKDVLKTTILDIEAKLEQETNRNKEESIRLVTEAAIVTSRQYHGV